LRDERGLLFAKDDGVRLRPLQSHARTQMKTTVRYLSLNRQATWHRQVAEQLKHLHSLAAITAAEVVLEHQREAKPAFCVQVRLEVSGPGPHPKSTRHTRQAALRIHGPALHAEARDNTIEAALLKATQDLEHQIRAHQLRHQARGKSRLQLSAVSSRWTEAHSARTA
jgi:ribosome-associated translation inhibitor RaiA